MYSFDPNSWVRAIAIKTPVEIDAQELEKATRIGGIPIKQTAINAALSEYLQRMKRLDLLAMRGNVLSSADLDARRSDPRERWR